MERFIKANIIKAGQDIMPLFGKVRVLFAKTKITDIVTRADFASQRVLVRAIQQKYPGHGIVAEESQKRKTDADYVWYIDPLDGTRNFATRIPLFGVNMALAYKGKIKYAAIYLPATKELCYAEEGGGAYLNDRKIKCSVKKDWKGVYGLGPPGYGKQYSKFLVKLNTLTRGTGWVNSIGSPAVSGVWIADGRRDWYIGPSANSWDYAAPYLIAKEAGCIASNFSGREWRPGDRGLILANKYLYPKLLEIIKTSFS